MRTLLFIFALSLSLISFARAEVTLKNVAEKEIEVTTADGKKTKKRVPITNATPGQEVIYTTTFANDGSKPAANVAITNPVPEHTAYVGGSAFGANAEITFSIDGGKTYATADKLIVKKDGVERLALPSEYTHIRWSYKVELAAGQSSEVGFKTQVQ